MKIQVEKPTENYLESKEVGLVMHLGHKATCQEALQFQVGHKM